jgi:hypothetical protein
LVSHTFASGDSTAWVTSWYASSGSSPHSDATQVTMSRWAIRNASSSGRADPADMMWLSDSCRGHGHGTPLIRSTTSTVFIAHSTATPQVSPSPWRACPSPRESSAPDTLTPR